MYYDWGGSNDSPGTSTDVDALGPPCIRFKDADDATIDSNDLIVVPGAGDKYSRWKHVYLKCSNADSHTMNNFAVYSDGSSFNANVDVNIGDETPTKNSGSDAGYEVADTADEEMSADHADITGTTSLFDYTAGEATDFDVSVSETDNVVNAANETTDYIVLQMVVASTADPGDLANETATWSYDEA